MLMEIMRRVMCGKVYGQCRLDPIYTSFGRKIVKGGGPDTSRIIFSTPAPE